MAYSRCLIMKNKPRIRFKGFTEDWEQRKLGEIFEYLQNNTLSRDSLNYKNPNVKNIHYGDILVKFDEILDGSSKDIPYINSEFDLSKFSKSLLRDGDIIFSDTAEDDTVGKAIELQNVNAPFILSGLHTIPCRPLIPFGKGYLGNFLNSNSYRMQLRPLVQGIKVSSISKSALKDTMIEYPKNLDEQEKIGSLFQNIAKMITLHQRKLEKLKLTKKALLQILFPKNGSQFPEVRFKNFCDSWKPYKLGHYFKKYQNVIYLEDDVVYKQISVRNNGVIEYRCSTKGKDIGRKRQYIIDTMLYPDTLTFTRQTVYEGGIGFVPKTLDGAIVTENMPLLAMRNSNKDFMMALFNSQSYIFGVLNKNALSGSAQKALHERDWLNSVLLFPDIEEQNLIGRLINMIDKYIVLHYRKLDKLYGVKKSLLQKMFV